MPEIIYVDHLGSKTVVDLEIGSNLMVGARDNGVSGIRGDCGGCCACGTCHVVIDERWSGLLPARSEMEESMLEIVPGANEFSRLACQVEVTEALAGIIVQVPDGLD